MEKAKISPGQLFALIVLFEMGTAVIRVLGLKAEKDAWLAILLGLAGGIAMFVVYASLYRLYPGLPLTGYMRAILGRWIGWPIGLLYLLFFIYGASRDLREGSDLLVSSVLDQTPVIVVGAIMMMSVSYVLNKGIETLARTAQVYIVVLLAAALFSHFLILVSGMTDINRLLPVLSNGWGPVLETTIKQTAEFPHEEVICFTMLLPYLQEQKKGIRAGYAAILASGLILSYSTAVNIAVLGIEIASRATFPLLTTVSLINVREFIQRLDVLVVLTLIIGDFFKVAIYVYAAVLAATDLFRLRDHRRIVNPIGVIIIFLAMMISGSYAEQIEEGDLLLYTVFLLFGVGVPLFLLAAAIARKRFLS